MGFALICVPGCHSCSWSAFHSGFGQVILKKSNDPLTVFTFKEEIASVTGVLHHNEFNRQARFPVDLDDPF